MVARRCQLLPGDLSINVVIQIMGQLNVISIRPLKDLRMLRVTCRFMCCVCRTTQGSRRIVTERVSNDIAWH